MMMMMHAGLSQWGPLWHNIESYRSAWWQWHAEYPRGICSV